eukprot:5281908-Pyramimonas_sp.AAC.3
MINWPAAISAQVFKYVFDLYLSAFHGYGVATDFTISANHWWCSSLAHLVEDGGVWYGHHELQRLAHLPQQVLVHAVEEAEPPHLNAQLQQICLLACPGRSAELASKKAPLGVQEGMMMRVCRAHNRGRGLDRHPDCRRLL